MHNTTALQHFYLFLERTRKNATKRFVVIMFLMTVHKIFVSDKQMLCRVNRLLFEPMRIVWAVKCPFCVCLFKSLCEAINLNSSRVFVTQNSKKWYGYQWNSSLTISLKIYKWKSKCFVSFCLELSTLDYKYSLTSSNVNVKDLRSQYVEFIGWFVALLQLFIVRRTQILNLHLYRLWIRHHCYSFCHKRFVRSWLSWIHL